MIFKYSVLFCVLLFLVDSNAFVRRSINASTTSSPFVNVEALKKNMDEFKNCIDHSLANVIGEVNENQLQPLFTAIGDHLNRFSKAFDDIIAKPDHNSESDS